MGRIEKCKFAFFFAFCSLPTVFVCLKWALPNAFFYRERIVIFVIIFILTGAFTYLRTQRYVNAIKKGRLNMVLRSVADALSILFIFVMSYVVLLNVGAFPIHSSAMANSLLDSLAFFMLFSLFAVIYTLFTAAPIVIVFAALAGLAVYALVKRGIFFSSLPQLDAAGQYSVCRKKPSQKAS